jgi:hypothetical protein
MRISVKSLVFTKLQFESTASLEVSETCCSGIISIKAVFASSAFIFRILFETEIQVKTMAAQLRRYMIDCAMSSQTNATLRSELFLAASARSVDEWLSRAPRLLAMAAFCKNLPDIKQN